MLNPTDFERSDGTGTIDWAMYNQARVEAGEVCCKCGGYIILGGGPGPAQCRECEGLSRDSGEASHPRRVRCPKCAHIWNPFDHESYHVYEEGEHELDCPQCGHSVEISTTVRYSLRSPALLPA